MVSKESKLLREELSKAREKLKNAQTRWRRKRKEMEKQQRELIRKCYMTHERMKMFERMFRVMKSVIREHGNPEVLNRINEAIAEEEAWKN